MPATPLSIPALTINISLYQNSCVLTFILWKAKIREEKTCNSTHIKIRKVVSLLLCSIKNAAFDTGSNRGRHKNAAYLRKIAMTNHLSSPGISKLFGLWSSWFWRLNGKEALYGIGGSSALRNGDGKGGGGLGYSLCRGTRTGGNTNKRRKNENISLMFCYCFEVSKFR